jgi:hypothetical protein
MSLKKITTRKLNTLTEKCNKEIEEIFKNQIEILELKDTVSKI